MENDSANWTADTSDVDCSLTPVQSEQVRYMSRGRLDELCADAFERGAFVQAEADGSLHLVDPGEFTSDARNRWVL